MKFKKVFICDRCGRKDFINGHALGGHKKYCQKPEYYDKFGKKINCRKNKKKNKKKNKNKNEKKKTVWNKDLQMDLGGIIDSMDSLFGLNFEKNTKKQEKIFEKKLIKILNSKDFEDILIIRYFLNFNKENLKNQIKLVSNK
jgi:hypothetical protein